MGVLCRLVIVTDLLAIVTVIDEEDVQQETKKLS